MVRGGRRDISPHSHSRSNRANEDAAVLSPFPSIHPTAKGQVLPLLSFLFLPPPPSGQMEQRHQHCLPLFHNCKRKSGSCTTTLLPLPPSTPQSKRALAEVAYVDQPTLDARTMDSFRWIFSYSMPAICIHPMSELEAVTELTLQLAVHKFNLASLDSPTWCLPSPQPGHLRSCSRQNHCFLNKFGGWECFPFCLEKRERFSLARQGPKCPWLENCWMHLWTVEYAMSPKRAPHF